MRNVATDGWQRPVYFANTLNPKSLNLDEYLRWKVLPTGWSQSKPLRNARGPVLWVGRTRAELPVSHGDTQATRSRRSLRKF